MPSKLEYILFLQTQFWTFLEEENFFKKKKKLNISPWIYAYYHVGKFPLTPPSYSLSPDHKDQ